jgi:hydroxypyruvate reductase
LSLQHQRPLCVIASGETTVRVTGHGKGGRNQEFALAAATDLPALGTAALASIGTDGIDGPTNAAGAIADSATIARARERHLNAEAALRENDAHSFFAALGDLVVTGPTETNVGDVQILLIE